MTLFQIQQHCLRQASRLAKSLTTTSLLHSSTAHNSLTWSLTRRAMSSSKNFDRFLKKEAYINGKWVGADSGKTFEILNPANGKVVGTVAECGLSDAEKAVESAKNAFKTWRDFTGKERAALLRKLFDLQMKNQEALAQLITAEMGKPLVESRGEIAYGASFLGLVLS